MTISEQVRAARNPQDAIIALADALDRVEQTVTAILAEVQREPQDSDPWGEWVAPPDDDDDFEAKHQAALRAMTNTEAREIKLPPASQEKRDRRRLFAEQQLSLNSVLPSQEGVDWIETYVKGGPAWLYSTSRDTVMSYDFPVRQSMVADVEEDDPKLAYQMSLDILKQPAGEPDFENGSGALAVGWIGKK